MVGLCGVMWGGEVMWDRVGFVMMGWDDVWCCWMGWGGVG